MLSKVCGNCFIFSDSVDINKNVRKCLGSTRSEKLDCLFLFKGTKRTKKNFVDTDKESTCAKSQRNILNPENWWS